MARTRGFSAAACSLREAMPNAVISTVTLAGVQITFLIGGTVLVERIFSYEGIGNMAVDAMINRDLPLIQGLVLTFAVLFIAHQPPRSTCSSPGSTRGCSMAEIAARAPRPPAAGSGSTRAPLVGGAIWSALLLLVGARARRWLAPHDPLAQDLLSA